MTKSKLLAYLSISLLLVGCGSGESTSSSKESNTGTIEAVFTSFTVSGYETRHTDIQLAYLDSTNYEDTTPYDGNLSKSAPNPVHLVWECTGGTGNYNVLISESESFETPLAQYSVQGNEFDFYNTELGKTYYARIDALGNGTVSSEVKNFTTDSRGPRNLYIEGVENVRDLGGWGDLKQGMLYRSGRLNEDKTDEVTPSITESGIYEMNNVLKIKTEIDLRKTSTNEVGSLTDTSVLGSEVNYVQLPMCYNGNNILTYQGKVSGDDFTYDNPARIKDFFDILSDETNYPIDFHCSIGKDRTGCLSYLVEGLMGASEENLMRDYMFTNFSKAGWCKPADINEKYGKTLSEYENGSSLQEKIYNYLNAEVGVSTETLDKVISILSVD